MTYMPTPEFDVFEQDEVPTVEDLSEGDTSPSLVVYDLNVTDFVRYAGAAGDFNPSHHDKDWARERYDDIIMMGMHEAGFLTHLMTKWVGLSSIDYFRTQFDGLVFPGDTLECYAEVTDIDGDQVTCDLVIENDDGNVVTSGEFKATLPADE